MRLLARLLAARAAWRAARRGLRHAEPPPPVYAHAQEPDPRAREVPRAARAELLVAALLLAAALCGIAFVVLYVLHDDTQLLGLAGGLGLAALAVALAVASFRVVPQVTAVEPRGPLADPPSEADVAEDLRDGAEGVSRRRLLTAAGGAAVAGLGAAAVVPAASLGPRMHGRLIPSPWRAGRPLVDEDGERVSADDLEVGGFMTAFPEGADKRELGSAVVVVRVAPQELAMPPERRGWAPEGLVAFSKVCTHAGCAVALYRSPKYEPTSSPPGLVCPCHYSTFDVRRSAKVVFGPAGRPLPQLPLRIAADRTLTAGGPLSGPVGPAWWGVG
ncbi:MAG TPA: Rieske (2Fe-2S) protein [Solirubrobacteraceae bacterium]|nr:Rieske (2Fe-2S) protein [Solirubrobacteraceae bacterium]